MLNYNVIATGSKGNAVVVENVMVDCGVPYKRIGEALYGVDYLLITHRHTDHVRKKTYERIRKNFPDITVITNSDVAKLLGGDVDFVIKAGEPLEVGEYTFEAFECLHNVPCYGYTWAFWDGEEDLDIIYATDTKDFRNAPRKDYDYLFLESNHDECKLNAVKYNSRKLYGYDAYSNGKRHCSTQKCKGFYFMHRKSKDSVLVELHMSDRFY